MEPLFSHRATKLSAYEWFATIEYYRQCDNRFSQIEYCWKEQPIEIFERIKMLGKYIIINK